MKQLTQQQLTDIIKQYDFGYDLDLIEIHQWKKLDDESYVATVYLECNTTCSSKPIPAEVEVTSNREVKVKLLQE